MGKKRIYLYLAAALTLPLIIIAFTSSVNSSEDKPCRWDFFRAFPLKWEGPSQNASSSDLSSVLTLAAEENVELDLAGATSTATPFSESIPPLTHEPVSGIAGQDARCRYGPNTAFHVLTYLQPGDTVVVLARTSASDWLRVATQPEGIDCWVWKTLLLVEGDVASLPVDPGPSLPTPTPTKTPEPTPRPGCWVENDPQYPNGVCKPLPCGPNDYPATACELP
jgi:hypothetical protein